jgi:hypothetical protein
MYFSLEIEPNDVLLMTQQDVAQALWVLSQKLMVDLEMPIGPNMGPVIDSYGNTVGHWLLKK